MCTKTILFLLLLIPISGFSQSACKFNTYSHSDSVIANSLRIKKAIQKIAKRKGDKIAILVNKQQRLQLFTLRKLSKKENKFLSRLKVKDSVAYSRELTKMRFDSLRTLVDQNGIVTKTNSIYNRTIDSIKKLKAFGDKVLPIVNEKSTGQNGMNTDQLTQLETKLNVEQHVKNLISQRTDEIQKLGRSYGLGKFSSGIFKTSFCYQQKLKGYKRIVDDPGFLETTALVFLKRVPGFEQAMMETGIENGTGMGTAKSVEDLEKMGFQTKRQMKSQLDKQFGFKSPELLQQLKGKVVAAQKQLQNGKSQIQQNQNVIKEISFKPNPLKGTPFRYRLKSFYNWQVLNARLTTPVIFEFNSGLGYQHSQRLNTNFVTGASIGLGSDWQHVHLTFQGLKIGINSDWKWMWGISAQAGFERVYKTFKASALVLSEDNVTKQVVFSNHRYRDIAYTGIQKSYKLNSKFSGTMLIGYDWLWKRDNKGSPIIWRVGCRKN